MPPRTLKEPLQTFQHQIIETMLAANGGRYPASHSDMAYCVQGLLKLYIIDRRPLPTVLTFADENGQTNEIQAISGKDIIGIYFPTEKQGRHAIPTHGPDNQATGWCLPGQRYEVVEERLVSEPPKQGQLFPNRTFWLRLKSIVNDQVVLDWAIMQDLSGHTTGTYVGLLNESSVEEI